MTTVYADQLAVEAIGQDSAPKAWVDQLAVSVVWASAAPGARADQLAVEVLRPSDPPPPTQARLSQASAEVLSTNPAPLSLTRQVALEVLRPNLPNTTAPPEYGRVKAFAFDIAGKSVSEVTFAKVGATALYADLLSDTLYAVDGTQVVPLLRGDPLTGVWRSGIQASGGYVGFGALRVDGDMDEPVRVKLYADGTLFFDVTLNAREAVRVPGGSYRYWEVEVESTGRVSRVTLAPTMGALREA